MVVEIIVAIMTVIGLAGLINLLESIKHANKISFKETFDLLNAPIVTFVSDNRKLHFLLDTGSSLSHIRPSIVDSLGIESQAINEETLSANGTIASGGKCSIPLEYNGREYTAEFMLTPQLAESLDALKRDFNLDVHGILGCNFFNKYDYIVDFKELVAYSKKNE